MRRGEPDPLEAVRARSLEVTRGELIYEALSERDERWEIERRAAEAGIDVSEEAVAERVESDRLLVIKISFGGREEEWIADPRFASNPKRVENREVLLPLIAEVMSRETCDRWMELFVDAAIPCGPVNDMQHLFSDPQVLHSGMIVETPHPTIGPMRLAGIPVRYTATPGSVRRPPPLLGEHTDAVLAEVLGYGPQEIEELRRQEAI